MITTDFSKKFQGTDGKDSETKLSTLLIELVASETTGNALKLLGWVDQLRTTDQLVLDEYDTKVLKELIENNQRSVILLKGQLLRCFKD